MGLLQGCSHALLKKFPSLQAQACKGLLNPATQTLTANMCEQAIVFIGFLSQQPGCEIPLLTRN